MESVVILCLGNTDMEKNLYKFSTDKDPMGMEGHMESPSSLCVIYIHWNFHFLKSSFCFLGRYWIFRSSHKSFTMFQCASAGSTLKAHSSSVCCSAQRHTRQLLTGCEPVSFALLGDGHVCTPIHHKACWGHSQLPGIRPDFPFMIFKTGSE